MMEISNIVVTLVLLLIHNNKAQTTEEWSSAEPDQNMKAQVTLDRVPAWLEKSDGRTNP